MALRGRSSSMGHQRVYKGSLVCTISPSLLHIYSLLAYTSHTAHFRRCLIFVGFKRNLSMVEGIVGIGFSKGENYWGINHRGEGGRGCIKRLGKITGSLRMYSVTKEGTSVFPVDCRWRKLHRWRWGHPALAKGSLGGGSDGGGLCRMSITRNGNVALSNLGKPHVAISI